MSLKFFNLHGHSMYSVYDGIGSVDDYVEQVLKNAGEDSGGFTISDHGCMNYVGSMAAAQKKYGDKVKLVYGMEAYYIPSVSDWSTLKAVRDEQKKEDKKTKEDDDDSGLLIENEKESKSRLLHYDPITRRNHLVLVAYNQQGLSNLFRLVSRSYRQGFYKKPRIDVDMLKELNEGLIASTACLAGIPTWCSLHSDSVSEENKWKIYDQELLPLMQMFGKDRFFLELQFNKIPEQQIVNKDVIAYSKRTGYNLIATCDSHYPQQYMWKDREIYKLLGFQTKKENIDMSVLEKDIDEIDAQLYLKNGDQMFATYKETFAHIHSDEQLIKEAIERTYDIAHNYIENVHPDDKIKLPKSFQVTGDISTPYERLAQLVKDALKKKNLFNQEYIDRATYELKVIKKFNVSEYFLVLKDILDVLRKRMLIGCGRGSGAGSLVNYLINITNIDPIKNGLLFERFLSPSRAELPDIDSDIELRDESIDILKEHFGQDIVLAISNYNRLTLKPLIKDLSKLYGIPFQEVNAVTSVAESEAKDAIMAEIGYDQKLYEFTFEKAVEHSPTFKEFLETYPHLGESVKNLYKGIRAISRHAGGILVVPDAEAYVPIIRIRGIDQSPIVEGITAQHCKHFGLVKYDLLGLGTLRIIHRCIEIILENDGQKATIDNVWEFYNMFLHPDVINPEDQNVFNKVYCGGKFPSIFQFEKGGAQRFCVNAQPKSVSDISAMTALFRPGPLKNKADLKYVNYDEYEIKREHPIIQEILGPTRGLLVYQEQFMLLANKLAGFTLEEADKLRKLLVKPSTTNAEQIKQERKEIGDKFVAACVQSGLSKDRAETLWEKEILGFISYGFNKSHSVAYAYNSYMCAWLFTYYEKEWIKACLEKDPELDKTITSTRGLGFAVDKVDVNHSPAEEWNFVDGAWKPPLTALKGVGLVAARELLKEKPESGFKDINDFFFDQTGKWRWSKLNKKVCEALIKAESFASISCVGPNKPFKNYKHMHYFVSENWDDLKKKKISFDNAVFFECEDWPVSEKINIQRELLGFYDKSLLVGKFQKMFNEFSICAVDQFGEMMYSEEDYAGPMLRVWFIVEKVTEKLTVNGKPYHQIVATGMTEKQYHFKVWGSRNPEDDIEWTEGSIVVASLDYSEQYGYSLSRRSKVMKVTR